MWSRSSRRAAPRPTRSSRSSGSDPELMAAGAQPPLTIWAVSDGRTGIEAQVLGLAEAVGRLRPAEIVIKRIAWRWGLGRLPAWLNAAPHPSLADPAALSPPWPDIRLAAGR